MIFLQISFCLMTLLCLFTVWQLTESEKDLDVLFDGFKMLLMDAIKIKEMNDEWRWHHAWVMAREREDF